MLAQDRRSIVGSVATEDDLQSWEVRRNGSVTGWIVARSVSMALIVVRDSFPKTRVEAGIAETNETVFVELSVSCSKTGESGSTSIAFHPAEPTCLSGRRHSWTVRDETDPFDQTPGGMMETREGVLVTEVCCHCGCYKVTDAFEKRADHLHARATTLSYRSANTLSLSWIARSPIQRPPETLIVRSPFVPSAWTIPTIETAIMAFD
jgi:hypothetical protein